MSHWEIAGVGDETKLTGPVVQRIGFINHRNIRNRDDRVQRDFRKVAATVGGLHHCTGGLVGISDYYNARFDTHVQVRKHMATG